MLIDVLPCIGVFRYLGSMLFFFFFWCPVRHFLAAANSRMTGKAPRCRAWCAASQPAELVPVDRPRRRKQMPSPWRCRGASGSARRTDRSTRHQLVLYIYIWLVPVIEIGIHATQSCWLPSWWLCSTGAGGSNAHRSKSRIESYLISPLPDCWKEGTKILFL